VNKVPPPHPTMQHYQGSRNSTAGPRTSAPGHIPNQVAAPGNYPWKEKIVTTVFWVGETPTKNNPTTNVKSSWDPNWMKNYGGYDTPDKTQRTYDFCPKGFTPKQNPFYCALPYNDVEAWNKTKKEARLIIPWYRTYFKKPGKSVLKGRWIAIRHGQRVCYAQWEDVGPFQTDDWSYVFSRSRPLNQNNKGAGLDVSPAVRDFLRLTSGKTCDWKFVELGEVPGGPWKKYGNNNHFVVSQAHEVERHQAEMERLRKLRDEYLRNRK